MTQYQAVIHFNKATSGIVAFPPAALLKVKKEAVTFLNKRPSGGKWVAVGLKRVNEHGTIQRDYIRQGGTVAGPRKCTVSFYKYKEIV